MNVLITAIGSMSAECVITKLKEQGHTVIGCDIYPAEWHYESRLCDVVYRAPYATECDEYISFLLELSAKHEVTHIVPLTDLEIDVLNEKRKCFEEKAITLCIQDRKVLDISRNKYRLAEFFMEDGNVPSIRTYFLRDVAREEPLPFPCIAKPYNGRSSEGLMRNVTPKQLELLDKDIYIVQEQKEGTVFTVDYCRNALTKTDCAVPREELLRTKNGAGTTVNVTNDSELIHLVSYIGNKLNINGCVNMEFIHNTGKFYLIDINPRFSAGVAFSVIAGYDMINNHMNCFVNKEIGSQIKIEEYLMVKNYNEIVLRMNGKEYNRKSL